MPDKEKDPKDESGDQDEQLGGGSRPTTATTTTTTITTSDPADPGTGTEPGQTQGSGHEGDGSGGN